MEQGRGQCNGNRARTCSSHAPSHLLRRKGLCIALFVAIGSIVIGRQIFCGACQNGMSCRQRSHCRGSPHQCVHAQLVQADTIQEKEFYDWCTNGLPVYCVNLVIVHEYETDEAVKCHFWHSKLHFCLNQCYIFLNGGWGFIISVGAKNCNGGAAVDFKGRAGCAALLPQPDDCTCC